VTALHLCQRVLPGCAYAGEELWVIGAIQGARPPKCSRVSRLCRC